MDNSENISDGLMTGNTASSVYENTTSNLLNGKNENIAVGVAAPIGTTAFPISPIEDNKLIAQFIGINENSTDATNSGNETGDFPEDDLEVIDEGEEDDGEGGEGSGGGNGGGGATTANLNVPDIDEIKETLERIKKHKFKFPSLGADMFKAEVNSNDIFYKYQAPLKLYNRLAKNVFSKKRPMSVESSNGYFKFIREYSAYFNFVMTALDKKVKATSGTGYYINPSASISVPAPARITIQVNGNGEATGIVDGDGKEINVGAIINTISPLSSFTISEIEDELNNADSDISTIMDCVRKLAYIDSVIFTDNSLYRIISLAAFVNPEFFGDYWLKPHMDFMFRYYTQTELGFSNIPTAPFEMTQLDESAIYSMMRQNFNLYNIINTADREDYIVYIFENLKIKDKVKKSAIYRMRLRDELEANSDSIQFICAELKSFYEFSLKLQNNVNNKNLSLSNLQKLSSLQKESYASFIRDIDLQTLAFGI